MRSTSLMSFRDELLKIAMSLDADTRNNMAMRHEEEDFLLEGRLNSNDTKESNYFPKLGEEQAPESTRERLQKKYRKARKPGTAALKGAFGGAFLGQLVTGGNLGGAGWKKQLGLRGFAGLGAGVGLADHYAGKHYKRKKRQERAEAKLKVAMVGSETFTPGRALTQGRNTSRFQDKVIHKGGNFDPATIGRKFRLATE